MNDLITSLSDKARYSVPHGMLSPDAWIEYYNKKLAELVVLECVAIVEDAVDHREPASTYSNKIKQHFGIKS